MCAEREGERKCNCSFFSLFGIVEWEKKRRENDIFRCWYGKVWVGRKKKTGKSSSPSSMRTFCRRKRKYIYRKNNNFDDDVCYLTHVLTCSFNWREFHCKSWSGMKEREREKKIDRTISIFFFCIPGCFFILDKFIFLRRINWIRCSLDVLDDYSICSHRDTNTWTDDLVFSEQRGRRRSSYWDE